MVRPVLLVCNTRTGSTAFGNALSASNPGVMFTGECFNPTAVNQPDSFVGWILSNNISAYRFLAEKKAVAHEYLDWVTNTVTGRILLLDLKYHDTLAFMPNPSLLDFPPVIFAALKDLGGSVIHLVRQDKFASSISEVIANRSNFFHLVKGGEKPKIESFEIPWLDLEAQIRLRYFHEASVRRQLGNSLVDSIEIKYEDVFGTNNTRVMEALGTALEEPLNLDNVVHEKIGVDYQSIVTNFDDLANRAESENWTTFWR